MAFVFLALHLRARPGFAPPQQQTMTPAPPRRPAMPLLPAISLPPINAVPDRRAPAAGAGLRDAATRLQFTEDLGRGMPGRSRGTQTRSAPEIVQVTGVDISIDSPSTPTGICCSSAVISDLLGGQHLPGGMPATEETGGPPGAIHLDAHRAGCRDRARARAQPARSPVPYGLLVTSKRLRRRFRPSARTQACPRWPCSRSAACSASCSACRRGRPVLTTFGVGAE
jgi:hypothetical protein